MLNKQMTNCVKLDENLTIEWFEDSTVLVSEWFENELWQYWCDEQELPSYFPQYFKTY